MDGIAALGAAGFADSKLDTVVMRGVNEDELVDLIEYGRSVGAQVRFIEYMDVGGATAWTEHSVVTRAEILETLGRSLGSIEPVSRLDPAAPAELFTLRDGTRFGVISSMTKPFCQACDRARLTADGMWFLCLYAKAGIDLRNAIREGATDMDLRGLIEQTWRRRTERAAELRLTSAKRRPSATVAALRQDPHLEMHTRGG
jgi:GTP 3',8-cyclase